MDGELWLGGGSFEALVGIVRRQTPDAMAWGKLRCMVFELPHGDGDFATRAASIRTLAAQAAWPQLVAVEQAMVAERHSLRRRLDAVIAAGGEGLMLHRADAPYRSGRSLDLLKLKPLQDAEALVIGQVGGRGRHAGRLGALRVRTADGVEFLLGSGLSDAARASPPALGTIVSFTHRGQTNAGVPRFASFLRLRLLQLRGPVRLAGPARLMERSGPGLAFGNARAPPRYGLRALRRRNRPGASVRRAPASRGRHAASP